MCRVVNVSAQQVLSGSVGNITVTNCINNQLIVHCPRFEPADIEDRESMWEMFEEVRTADGLFLSCLFRSTHIHRLSPPELGFHIVLTTSSLSL